MLLFAQTKDNCCPCISDNLWLSLFAHVEYLHFALPVFFYGLLAHIFGAALL